MARKKPKRFSATKAVKAAARDLLGTPRPTRREDASPRRKREKHKPTLGKLLAEDS